MGFCPQLGVWGHAPAQCIWQGSGFAADQTNAMLAVARRRPPSPSPERTTNPSSRRKRQDSLSLSLVLFPPKPLRWVSAGALLGAVIKTPMLYFLHFCVGGITTLRPLCLCRNNSAQGLFQQKKAAFSEWVLCADERAVPSCTQRFLAPLCGGVSHYPRRALHAVETLDARGSRRRIRCFYAATVLALCGLNLPSSGTHTTPAFNRAHSGSHAETRRVIRVDGDDVSGNGIIDTIDPFQADQTVAVALAEGHRNAVSP